jgi:hypothetical protein
VGRGRKTRRLGRGDLEISERSRDGEAAAAAATAT